MALEDPARRQVSRADQPGLVGMMADRHEVDVDAGRLEDHRGPADRQLADPAVPQAAADGDALGVAPALEPQEARDHEASSWANSSTSPGPRPAASGSPSSSSLSSFFLLISSVGVVAERVVADLPQPLAPIVQHRAEGADAARSPRSRPDRAARHCSCRRPPRGAAFRAMQEAGRRLFVVGHGFARELLSEGAT